MPRVTRSSSSSAAGARGCGCVAMYFVATAVLGRISVNYLLESLIGKTVPFLPAAIVGFFLGGVTIPGALVCWILRLCGIHTPFFGGVH